MRRHRVGRGLSPAPAKALEEVMTALSPRETRILLLRWLEDGKAHTLESGREFGLTRGVFVRSSTRRSHDCAIYRCAQLKDYLR